MTVTPKANKRFNVVIDSEDHGDIFVVQYLNKRMWTSWNNLHPILILLISNLIREKYQFDDPCVYINRNIYLNSNCD